MRLIPGINWSASRVRKHDYVCPKCNTLRRFHRHLYRTPVGEALAHFRDERPDIKEGYVYVVSNPAWPGYVKIGSAIDVGDRLRSFQTSDPFRSYELQGWRFFNDRLVAEYDIHRFLDTYRVGGEWFKLDAERATFMLKAFDWGNRS